MASRKGTLLERDVHQLLKLSGFTPELNKRYRGYEIDVFLNLGKIKIGFECKQYEKSSLVVRNLIHQWDSKNKILKLDRIVLVLIGMSISGKDYLLAKKCNIIIWNENKLNSLSESAIETKIDNKSLLFKELGISPDSKLIQLQPSLPIVPKSKTVREKIGELEREVEVKANELMKARMNGDNDTARELREEIKEIESTIKDLWEYGNPRETFLVSDTIPEDSQAETSDTTGVPENENVDSLNKSKEKGKKHKQVSSKQNKNPIPQSTTRYLDEDINDLSDTIWKSPQTKYHTANTKPKKFSWFWWIVLDIVALVLIIWLLPNNQSNQSEGLTNNDSQVSVGAEVKSIFDTQQNPIVTETWKLVPVRYYKISLNETYFLKIDPQSYNEGKQYYPVLVYNYDGELCKNDPINYNESERENVVRCPARWENPERIQIRKGDSLVVREDIDCKKLNLTSCGDFMNMNIKQDNRIVFVLINETTETRIEVP